jgi:hypothetical protein
MLLLQTNMLICYFALIKRMSYYYVKPLNTVKGGYDNLHECLLHFNIARMVWGKKL